MSTEVSASEVSAPEIPTPEVSDPQTEVSTTKVTPPPKTVVELSAYMRDTEGAGIADLQRIVGPSVRIRSEINTGAMNRILLSCEHGALGTSTLARACNGVVLEYGTWNILSLPAPVLTSRCKIGQLCKDISKYDVFSVCDGTTVTLYWYNGEWHMSSANAFDVRGYTWMGELTYLEAMTAAAPSGFDLAKLDKNKSYTVGFRHHDYHPLLTDPARMWLIQSFDRTTGKVGPAKIGIPPQPRADIPSHGVRDWVTTKNSRALDKYMVSARAGAPAIHYGYIFRAKNADNPDIVLESELLRKVRDTVYNLPQSQRKYIGAITPTVRLEYVVMKAYLCVSGRAIFMQLFPQFASRFKKYSETFAQLAAKIVVLLGDKAPAPPADGVRMDGLAVLLANHLRRVVQVNVMDAAGPSIVDDFLMHPQHLDLFYAWLVV